MAQNDLIGMKDQMKKMFEEYCDCVEDDDRDGPALKRNECDLCMGYFLERLDSNLNQQIFERTRANATELRDFIISWLEALERKDNNGAAGLYRELKNLPTTPKRDGYGEFVSPYKKYYIQDTRQIVGNCISWWGVDGNGYVCELDKAGIYDGYDVLRKRDTDLPWPVEDVVKAAIRHVRSEGLRDARPNQPPCSTTNCIHPHTTNGYHYSTRNEAAVPPTQFTVIKEVTSSKHYEKDGA